MQGLQQHGVACNVRLVFKFLPPALRAGWYSRRYLPEAHRRAVDGRAQDAGVHEQAEEEVRRKSVYEMDLPVALVAHRWAIDE